jgi:hypothetical protein
MSEPSMALLLFAVADAVARGRMPEPASVEYQTGSGLTLYFDNEKDGRRWAKRFGIDPTEPYAWSSQPYTSQHDGRHYTLTNGYGAWHGVTARVNVREPVPEPAQVAS